MEPKYKLVLEDINQILPHIDYFNKLKHINRIIPLKSKPKIWDDLKFLERNLKIQDHIYFQFNNKYYELSCLKGILSLRLTKTEKTEILRKQKEIYEQLGGNY